MFLRTKPFKPKDITPSFLPPADTHPKSADVCSGQESDSNDDGQEDAPDSEGSESESDEAGEDAEVGDGDLETVNQPSKDSGDSAPVVPVEGAHEATKCDSEKVVGEADVKQSSEQKHPAHPVLKTQKDAASTASTKGTLSPSDGKLPGPDVPGGPSIFACMLQTY